MLCIICSEHFKSGDDLVLVPCGHVFHSECLSKSLDSSETCPQCRKPVSSKDVRKLHMNIDDEFDPKAYLKTRINKLKAKLEEKDKELETAEKTLNTLQLLNAALEKGYVEFM